MGAGPSAREVPAPGGIDEVSRRRGQQYLTLVYDVERGRVVWVGKDRDETTLQRFFAWLGKRQAWAIQVVCCDMGRRYWR